MRSNVEIITANHKTYNYFITIQVMEPVEVAWVRAWCERGLANGNGMRERTSREVVGQRMREFEQANSYGHNN